jgi:hypothetical protein
MKCGQLSFSFTMALLSISMVLGTAIANQMPVGEITEIEGPAELVKDDGRQIRAEKGAPLFPGDQIITGKGGMVWFSFKQGDQYRLGEESQTSIDELSGPELEDNQPVLQLALGYLWSKIQKLRGQLHRTVVHTPTAVLGVRGTEFETVVSLDATSIVTVDDGTIEVEAEDEKTLVDRGKMTEVELDKKPMTPVQAIPKDRRDWKRWRKKRIKRLFKHLPQKAPKFRERFEMRADRFSRFTARIRKTSARIDATIKKIRQARRHRDRQKALESLVHLKVQAQKFKKMVAKFRKALNRVRVMGRLSHRLEKFASNNKERFSEQEFSVIDSNLAAVSEKRALLKTVIRNTVFGIKKTFKKLRKFREELRTIKSATNPHNPNRRALRVDQGL